MDQEMDFNFEDDLQEDEPSGGFTEKLKWFFKGFVFPLFSRPFYKQASQKQLGAALVFLAGFALLQTIVATTTVAVNLRRFGREIDTAYQTGEIPQIQIENGIADVSGSGRIQIENNRQFIGIDTTGAIQEIDTSRYSEGLLLTRTEIHFVNEDGYQVLPLSDLNKAFGNPIVLDGASVSKLWSGITVFINMAVLFGGFLFYSIGRFIYLVLLGLLVWGGASLGKSQIGFAPILITGIYANVPTTYVFFLLRKIGITFFGLRAIILLIIWGLVIAYLMKEEPISSIPEKIPGDFG